MLYEYRLYDGLDDRFWFAVSGSTWFIWKLIHEKKIGGYYERNKI